MTIAGVEFANPVTTASGCCGYGEELARVFPLKKLGGIVTKTITPEVRLGHPLPRTAETPSGMLNAIGLANVGIDRFISEKLPFLEKQGTVVIVNVGGKKIEEYVDLCERLDGNKTVDMIELNLGCPNVKEGGMEVGADPALAEKTVSEVKRATGIPIIAKLTPNVTDIAAIARAAEAGGADAVSLVNSLVGTAIDIETFRPRLSFNRGGLTGPAIKPIALAMVDAVYQSCKLPIIGIGGIHTWQDAVEFFLCGARAIQVGTALFVEPEAPIRIIDGLKKYMKKHNLATMDDLVGKVRKYD